MGIARLARVRTHCGASALAVATLASAAVALLGAAAAPSAGDPALSAREVYGRFLKNRFTASISYLRIVSSDPGGTRQEADLYVRWKDYRDADDEPTDGVISKTIVRFTYPADVWRLTYLLVGRRGRSHDQFVYIPQAGRTRRIQTHGIGILGTDYTLDDLVFQTLEDAEYRRLPDSEVSGRPAYVIAVHAKPRFATQYPRMVAYIDTERYVMLRGVFEDTTGHIARELLANVATITEMDGVWLATEATMTDLRYDTSSTLLVREIYTNTELPEGHFSAFELDHRR